MDTINHTDLSIGQSVIVSNSGNAPMRIIIDGPVKKHGGKGYEDMDIMDYIRPAIDGPFRNHWLTLDRATFYEDTGQKYFFQVMISCADMDEDLGYWTDKWFFDLDEAMTYASKYERGQCFQVLVEKIT